MTNLPKEITENGIRYTLQGDFYFPDFERPEKTHRLALDKARSGTCIFTKEWA